MARKKNTAVEEVEPDLVEEEVAELVEGADLEEEEAELDEEELGVEEIEEVVAVEFEAAIDEFAEEEEEEAEADEALAELEAEELELLEDEVSESILVDEVAELRAIRREELTMDLDAHAIRDDEFVCQSCFLVKRSSQIANRRKMICRDCAS